VPSGTSPQSAGEFGVVGEHAVECLGGRPAQVGGEDRKGLVGAEDRAHGFAAGALRRNEAGGGDGEFALGGLEVVADPDRADQHRADEVRPLVPRGGVQVAGPVRGRVVPERTRVPRPHRCLPVVVGDDPGSGH